MLSPHFGAFHDALGDLVPTYLETASSALGRLMFLEVGVLRTSMTLCVRMSSIVDTLCNAKGFAPRSSPKPVFGGGVFLRSPQKLGGILTPSSWRYEGYRVAKGIHHE